MLPLEFKSSETLLECCSQIILSHCHLTSREFWSLNPKVPMFYENIIVVLQLPPKLWLEKPLSHTEELLAVLIVSLLAIF